MTAPAASGRSGSSSTAHRRLAGAPRTRAGVERGDVVLTLVGNRPEWALTMLACFRQGYVVLPCTEQLRPKDLELAARRRAAPADRRRPAQRGDAARRGLVRRRALGARSRRTHRTRRRPRRTSRPTDPCLITFTSGTARRAEGRPARPALPHRPAPAGRPTGWPRDAASSCGARPPPAGASPRATRSSRPGCAAPPRCCTTRASTRTSGWSIIDREQRRRALHGPDGVPRDRQARHAHARSLHCRVVVAAGEALNPEVLHAWHEAIGLWIRDGYGQTETGQLTGTPLGEQPRPGSMGKPLPASTST